MVGTMWYKSSEATQFYYVLNLCSSYFIFSQKKDQLVNFWRNKYQVSYQFRVLTKRTIFWVMLSRSSKYKKWQKNVIKGILFFEVTFFFNYNPYQDYSRLDNVYGLKRPILQWQPKKMNAKRWFLYWFSFQFFTESSYEYSTPPIFSRVMLTFWTPCISETWCII